MNGEDLDKGSDVESDKSLEMNDEERDKVSHVESDKSLEMNDEDKKRYHHFEDVLHQRLLHRQLQDRSQVAQVLDLSKELVQSTKLMQTKIHSPEKLKEMKASIV